MHHYNIMCWLCSCCA